MGLIANRSDITWQPIRNNDISWNFQKWLIKHDGQPFKRYTSRTKPESIEDDIAMLLDQCTAAVYGPGNATSSNDTKQVASQKPAQAASLPQTFATETAPGPMQPSGVAPPQPVQPSVAQNAAQQPQQQQTQAAQQAPKANQKKRSLLFDKFQ